MKFSFFSLKKTPDFSHFSELVTRENCYDIFRPK